MASKLREHITDVVGRCVMAKEDFNMGDVILVEEPIISGPCNDTEEYICEEEEFVCICCFKVVKKNSDSIFLCTCCKWPFCCKKCPQTATHKRYECKTFASLRVQPSREAMSHIFLLRAVLSSIYDPDRFDDLITLSCQLQVVSDEFEKTMQENLEASDIFINSVCRVSAPCPSLDVILKIFYVNAFAMHEKDLSGNFYHGQAVYKMGCLISHSCAPNSDWMVVPIYRDGRTSKVLQIRARKDIKCGEEITIPYLQETLILSTPLRQSIFNDLFHFTCKCDRCLDPSELGTYLCALECKECQKNGMLLPQNPTNQMSDWFCNQCQSTKSSNFAEDSEQMFQTELRNIINTPDLQLEEKALNLSQLIQAPFNLHPNHRCVVRTCYYWLQLQTFQNLCKLSEESANYFSEIKHRVDKCLKAYDLMGYCEAMNRLDWLYANAVAAYYFKTQDIMVINYDGYRADEKMEIVCTLLAHLQRASNRIKLFPAENKQREFKEQLSNAEGNWTLIIETLSDRQRGVGRERGNDYRYSDSETSRNKFKPCVTLLRNLDESLQ